ncbi:MAG: discoidin domain-containing protein [Acidimicrobiales bacterium]
MTYQRQRRRHWYPGGLTALVATLAVIAGSLAVTVAPASAGGWYWHHRTTTTTPTSTTTSTTTTTEPTTTTWSTATSGTPGLRGVGGPGGTRSCFVRQHRRRGGGWVWARARCVVRSHARGAGNGQGRHNYAVTTTSSTTTSSTTTSTTSTTLAAANCTAAESGSPLSRAGWVASTNALSSGADLPANALDGNLATRFSTDEPEAAGLYFEVDLGSAQAFDELEMDVPNSTTDYARGYNVEVSSNGTTWTTVATCTGTGSPEIVSFPPQTAQYVEVVLTSGNPSNYWWSIDEFNLFNS